MNVISLVVSFGRNRKNLGYILVILATSLSLAVFLQSALVKRGFGEFFSIRLVVFELMFLALVILFWLSLSVFFSRFGGCELEDTLRSASLSLLPVLILLLNVPTMFVDFVNIEKPLFLLAFIVTAILHVSVFNDKLDFWTVVSSSSLKDAGVLLLLIMLGLLFFWRIISGSSLHQGSLAEDFNLFFPFRFFAATSLRKGIVPLWNPYVFSGTPFLADSQAAVLYPVNLLLTLLASQDYLAYRAAELTVVLHFVLAATFMYLYARTMKFSSFGALVSAVVFAFGGAMVSHVRHLPILNVVVWLPLILLFLEKGLVRRRLIYAVPAGIALGASILGGHLQMVLYVSYAVLAYGLFRLYMLRRENRESKGIRWAALLLATVFVLAVLLTAVQTLPTLELLPHSNRSIDVSYRLTTDFSLEAQNLITLVIPNFFGGIQGRYWGPWSYWWELCGYVGIFPLVLAALALLSLRKSEVRFFGAAALVSLLLALGGNTFLHPLTYLFLPGFSLNRAPSRFFYLFGFALSMLAGYGADVLVRRDFKLADVLFKVQRFLLWILAAFVPIALFFYYALAFNSSHRVRYEVFSNIVNGTVFFLILLGLSVAVIYLERKKISLTALKATVIALIIFDLFSFGWRWYVEDKSPQTYYPKDPIVEFLKRDGELFRVVNDEVLSPNAGSTYSIYTTSGSNPLSLKDYEEISDREDLLNVKYVLSKKQQDADKYRLVFSDGERKVFQKMQYIPRAFVPEKVVPERDTGLVDGEDFDPRKVSVVEGFDQTLSENRGDVQFMSYTPNKISLQTRMKNDGFVVLSEIYYPGWKAYVDGEERPVYRVDKLLRGIHVPKGGHKIDMTFEPASYRLGLWISLLTWLLVLGIAAVGTARFVLSKRGLR